MALDDLRAELAGSDDQDITKLRHVPSREERQAAEEVAGRRSRFVAAPESKATPSSLALRIEGGAGGREAAGPALLYSSGKRCS